MWRYALFALLITVPLEVTMSIIYPIPMADNTSESFPYMEPQHVRVDELIQRALAHFSLRLEDAVAPRHSSGSLESPNIVFSPLSIASVLALVLLGAQGVTHNEIAQLLGVTAGFSLTGRSSSVHEGIGRLLNTLDKQRASNNETVISIARGLFMQEDLHINQTFINNTMNIYHTEIQRVDFQRNPRKALNTINKWVESRTGGHIKDLVEQEPETATKLIIASALYFIGQWENPFYPGATKRKPFNVGKQAGSYHNEVVDVDLMVNGAEIPYYADPERKCTIIGMPYKGNKNTMFVIVPDEDVKTFMRNTGADDLEELVKRTEKTAVIFFLPRMRLESTINLVPPLRHMNITSLFDINSANLTNIAEGVFVNEAIHKVDIDINENGTVAAAATAFTFTRDGSSPVVRVDKPFVFFIRHSETGVILFWGTVIKPTPHYPHV